MIEKFEKLVNSCKWRLSKTYTAHPHEYFVFKERKAEFVEFAKFIRAHGYRVFAFGKDYWYLNIGEYKYWVQPENYPANFREMILCNRALICPERTARVRAKMQFGGGVNSLGEVL